MDIHQLKTFVTVAREGSITRASERLFLSQPAVSAHVKTMEEMLGITLFERTVRGMTLTSEGHRILLKAEMALRTHRELLDEANRIKGKLAGKLRFGVGGNWEAEIIGDLIRLMSENHPGVDISLHHGTSMEIVQGIRAGELDAGFYNETADPDPNFVTVEMSRFSVYVVASAGLIASDVPLNWNDLSNHPWIYPPASHCCGNAAESLFKRHNFRPKRVISIDRENVTRSMLASGTGIGLLHENTAREAEQRGEIDIVCETDAHVSVMFAYLQSRSNDPILHAVTAILESVSAADDRGEHTALTL